MQQIGQCLLVEGQVSLNRVIKSMGTLGGKPDKGVRGRSEIAGEALAYILIDDRFRLFEAS
ncbi:hypothetical protein PPS11_04475 [Pseudomonas putida S11]|nr:hypothetical protein PPS11_04475 [Pseudomonas putida S11]